MFKDLSLKSQAADFQAVLSEAEFAGFENNTLEYDEGIEKACGMIEGVRKRKGGIYLIGNGGSAAVVSHILTDFINVVGVRASTLHEPSLVTCMSNDYGYENVFSTPLSKIACKDDLLIAVSSSGKSENIINASKYMTQINAEVITLSGFDKSNPLRSEGHLNIWLPSNQYGLVEIGHLFLLHYLADRFKQ
jgi:D-sedoheptulose 7-phosphate isomerase